MSFTRMLKVLKKEFALGPRSPFFLYTIILPFALTAILQVAFGSLFAAQPRLAIYDAGNSAVAAEIRQIEGIDLTMVESEAELLRMVEANDFDAGLVLPSGFDTELLAGE